jgi:hypothetical protein
MKTMRIYLSILSFAVSIGGAIGSSLYSQETEIQNIVYEWLDYPGKEDDMCVSIQLQDCNDTGIFPCKCYGATYRKQSTEATQCGMELSRDTPPICF